MNGFDDNKLFPVNLSGCQLCSVGGNQSTWYKPNHEILRTSKCVMERTHKRIKKTTKAFSIKRFKWNLQLLHFSPKRGATLNLCNRLEENVFTFPWNKCPLTPEKTLMSRYRKVPSVTGFFLPRTRHKETLTATIDFVLKPKNEYWTTSINRRFTDKQKA